MQYPEMREELVGYLKALADPDYQREAWLDKKFPPGIQYDCLDFTIHFIYDNTDLAADPESLVGVILKDQVEVDAIKVVTTRLNKMFEKLGVELTDFEYLQSPYWGEVVVSAKEALKTIKDGNLFPPVNQ